MTGFFIAKGGGYDIAVLWNGTEWDGVVGRFVGG